MTRIESIEAIKGPERNRLLLPALLAALLPGADAARPARPRAAPHPLPPADPIIAAGRRLHGAR